GRRAGPAGAPEPRLRAGRKAGAREPPGPGRAPPAARRDSLAAISAAVRRRGNHRPFRLSVAVGKPRATAPDPGPRYPTHLETPDARSTPCVSLRRGDRKPSVAVAARRLCRPPA